MGSFPQELSLDLRACFTTKTIGDFLRDFSAIGNVTERALKLRCFVESLEEEMRKIDVFKRELPLCMALLNDAILYLKEESAKFKFPQSVEPVLEEFIPLKSKDCEEKGEDDEEEEGLESEYLKEKDSRDKKNWMSSVQLWNTDDNDCNDNISKTKMVETEDPFQGCANGSVAVKGRGRGRAFMSFKDEFSVHGLSLLGPGTKIPKVEGVCVGNTSISRANSMRAVSDSPSSGLRAGPVQQHHLSQAAVRKQRRCWSPELHRRFIAALQQLGGSQVATPKQIRELMQVDGLTNDEVKSHLQKYRLHTRRVPSGSTTVSATTASRSGVVLGGLWMSQDQYGDSSKASSSQSGSPQGPFQLALTTGDESTEDDSDAKSEGYSWKSHSQTKERSCV